LGTPSEVNASPENEMLDGEIGFDPVLINSFWWSSDVNYSLKGLFAHV
jgi:hypothetical protein